jgi:hypothetical protein
MAFKGTITKNESLMITSTCWQGPMDEKVYLSRALQINSQVVKNWGVIFKDKQFQKYFVYTEITSHGVY